MQTSALTPVFEALGMPLVPRPEAPGCPTVLTFGSPPEEYTAAREGCALLDATDRGLVRVTGGDASEFLHRILAGDVRGLAEGDQVCNLLLTPKGKVAHAFDLTPIEEGFDLRTAPGRAPALCAALDDYLFAEDVALEDRTEMTAPLELTGPLAEKVIAAVLGEGPTHSFDGQTLGISTARVAGSAGHRVEADPACAGELWKALVAAGATPVGLVVRDSLRIEAGAALQGVDLDEDIYPQEARLEHAFSLEKGCYVGQEVVAKIDTYQGLNKRLVALRVDQDDPVAAGTRLLAEQDGETRDLGQVTSWGWSFALDAGLVLAYAKRGHQEAGTVFRLGENGPAGTVVDLPVRPDALT